MDPISALVAVVVAALTCVPATIAAFAALKGTRQTKPTNGLNLSAKLDQVVDRFDEHAKQDAERFNDVAARLDLAGIPRV